MQQISILGCGWLGFPLAISLQRKGFSIKGSTTTIEKVDVLEKATIKGYCVSLDGQRVAGEITSFLKGSQTLILNIPPGMRSQPWVSFRKKTETLLPFIKEAGIKNVLFVSSTSVFGDFQGAVDEESIPDPQSISGMELLQTEQLLRSQKGFKTTVLRFGGLIGDNRHPVNYLAGRQQLSGGDAPVNLIHLEDCIGLIQMIIKKNFWNQIVHGVFPEHPLKKVYYIEKAKAMRLKPLRFLEEDPKNYKRVFSKIGTSLGYTYQKQI